MRTLPFFTEYKAQGGGGEANANKWQIIAQIFIFFCPYDNEQRGAYIK